MAPNHMTLPKTEPSIEGGGIADESSTTIPSTQMEEPIVEPTSSGCCGLLGRYPLLSVVGFAVLGSAVGVAISFWEPDNATTKTQLVQWLGLIGDLFIRVLKAVVLPMVFFNVMLSIVDMMAASRASVVGLKAILLYTFTTVVASIIGLITVLIFKGKFKRGTFDEDQPAFVKLQCNTPDMFVTEDVTNGTLTCMSGMEDDASSFIIDDMTGYFVRTSGGFADISLSDTLYEGVFIKSITDNIIGSFQEGNFAAVIIFAIACGVALGKVTMARYQGDSTKSSLVHLLQEINDLLLQLINWAISVTPFAVFSLIAKAIGSQEDLQGSFANVGYLMIANLVGFTVHIIVIDIGFLWLMTKESPFAYLSYIIPAQMTALATSSSAATLPVTMRCVKASGMVPDMIRNFVCPLGATVNMDGTAIGFPIACIWLAVLNGVDINIAHYILLIVLATVGSAGAAPVPSAGLVLIITAYNTVFGGTGVPKGFEFIVAIDWLADRFMTALNVTGDTVCCRIIAVTTNMGEMEELERMAASTSSDDDKNIPSAGPVVVTKESEPEPEPEFDHA
jgi:Na+/H+-dicarboxylate symporter